MGWDVIVGVGLGVTENKLQVVGGRIKNDWKRMGFRGEVFVEKFHEKKVGDVECNNENMCSILNIRFTSRSTQV